MSIKSGCHSLYMKLRDCKINMYKFSNAVQHKFCLLMFLFTYRRELDSAVYGLLVASLLFPLGIQSISAFLYSIPTLLLCPCPRLCGKYLEWQQDRFCCFLMAFKCLPVGWVIPGVSFFLCVMSYDGAWISWPVKWVSVDWVIWIWFPMKLGFFFATIFKPVVGLPTSCSVGTGGLFPSDEAPRACNNTPCDGGRNSWSFRFSPSQ